MVLLHKLAHMQKRGIAEPLHTHVNRARLALCEVSIFLRKNITIFKIHLPPTLKFIAMGKFPEIM